MIKSKLKRGMRINMSGYRGTVIEVTEAIPLCSVTCKCGASKKHVPGALVYWDFMVNGGSKDVTIYPEVLDPQQTQNANRDRGSQFQWVPLSKIMENKVK